MLIDVVGHEAAIAQLSSHIDSPRTTYIFHGPDGVGKKHAASAFFRQMACIGTHTLDCRCKACHQCLGGIHPDLRMLEPGGQSYGVAQIREMIEDAPEFPDSAPCKMYVLDNAGVMTTESSNALLKLLEEGAGRSIFVLVLEDESVLLSTIRSRSVSLRFSALDKETVIEFLSKFDRDTNKARLCGNLSAGSIGLGLEYLRGGRLAVRDSAIELLLTFHKRPPHQLMDIVDSDDSSESLFYLLRYMFADMALIRAGLEDRVANFDKLAQLIAIQSKLGEKAVVTGIEALNELYSNQPRIKASFSAHLKSALLKIRKDVARA